MNAREEGTCLVTPGVCSEREGDIKNAKMIWILVSIQLGLSKQEIEIYRRTNYVVTDMRNRGKKKKKKLATEQRKRK